MDATLALVSEQGTLPSASSIAARSGLSARSVFHHFPDMESLLTEVAATQGARHWQVLQPPEPGAGLAERIEAAVGQRARLFEAIGDVRRVALRYEPGFPSLSRRLQDSRGALRRHLRRALLPELSALDRAAVEGIQALASFEAWEVLRRHHGLSEATARAAVQSTTESAFDKSTFDKSVFEGAIAREV